MLLGLNFIGLSYLLVYIGAVSILFLFILMLINVRVSELQTENRNSLALGIIIGILFYYCLYLILPYNIFYLNNNELFYNIMNYVNNDISYVSSNTWDRVLTESSHITTIGNVIYSNYFL
jgi:NADH-ubiquinone oxidoreductase chain 6